MSLLSMKDTKPFAVNVMTDHGIGRYTGTMSRSATLEDARREVWQNASFYATETDHTGIVYGIAVACSRCDGSGRLPKRRGRKIVRWAFVDCHECHNTPFSHVEGDYRA